MPAVPFLVHGSDAEVELIDIYAGQVNHLIMDLKLRVRELESQLGEAEERAHLGVQVFNEMVELGTQTAHLVIEEANRRALEIVQAAEAASATAMASQEASAEATPPVAAGPETAQTESPTANVASFEDAWNRSSSFDERFAEAQFFENDPVAEAPARRWILEKS